MNLNYILNQSQQLNQLQIQGLSVLTLGNQELFEYCMTEQTENPTLELSEEVAEMYQVASYLKEQPTEFLAATSDDDTIEQELFEPQKVTLSEFLTSQLDHSRLTKEELRICGFLIDCLSANGYLEIPPLEISYLIKKPLPLIGRCIEEIQKLEPAGIGASCLSQCLLLQLARKGDVPPAMEALIKYHLEPLSQGYIKKVASALKISTSEVLEYLKEIKECNPLPGNGFSTESTQFVVPDVLFYQEDGVDKVRLNDSWTASLRISHLYASLESYKGDPEATAYLRDKINRARTLITAIHKRHLTLTAIADYLLTHQGDAIFRNAPLKPLSMKRLSEVLNIAPSTVTRAVAGKYYQSPKGTYLLRNLFVAGEDTKEDGKAGREEVKDVLRQLVEQEDTPLSDEALCQKLCEKGFDIKRRTVAKYREELGIPSAKARKIRI